MLGLTEILIIGAIEMKYWVLLSFFILCSCDLEPEYAHISFKNNCGSDLKIDYSYGYPEDSTMALERIAKKRKGDGFSIAPWEQKILSHGVEKSTSWKYYFIGEKAHFLSFYIFDANLINETASEKIKSDYMVLARYDFTEEDMDNLDWSFEYPPTEAMCNVHMYPSYDEIIANASP